MGNRQGVAFAPLPFPQRGRDGEFQPLPRDPVEPVDEMFLVLLHGTTLENPGTGHMMSPPEQGAERTLLRAPEIFRTVEVLIGEGFQMLPLHELHAGWVEIGRSHERGAAEFSRQGVTRRLQLPADLLRDPGLLAEELRVGYQRGFFFGEWEGMGHG